MKINSDEIAEYVQAVLNGINKGLSQEIGQHGKSETFSLSSPVKFQLGISNSRETNGEVRIFVVGLHGGKEIREDAKIEFEASDSGATLVDGLDRIITIWEKLSPQEREGLKKIFLDILKQIQTTPTENIH